MRVDIVSSYDRRGGAARAAFRLHRALLAAGAQSAFLAHVKETDDPQVFAGNRLAADLRAALDRLPLRAAGLPLHPYRSPAVVGVDLARRIAAHPCDVVHLQWICGGFVRPESLARIEKPLLWTLHDEWPFLGAQHYAGGEHRIDRRVLDRKRRAYARIARLTVIAPSRWLAERAAQSELFGRRRIVVIPYCVDTEVFSPRDKTAARAALGLPAGVPIALFAGDVRDPRKGFSHLSAAKVHDLRIAVAGPHAPEGTLALGQIGSDARLAVAYAAADLVVLPSLQDNLPNVALEALSCGTPCVAYRAGGLPDLVVEGRNGALAEPGADLAPAIERTLSQAADLGKAARAMALSQWSFAKVAQQHLELYASTLNERSSP